MGIVFVERTEARLATKKSTGEKPQARPRASGPEDGGTDRRRREPRTGVAGL